MTKTIGIFGLGLIGLALADRLLSAGYDVRGFDPDDDRQRLLNEKGCSENEINFSDRLSY